ncbi:MAG: isochorismatase family protein [Rhodospirillaceae bacterium]
MRTHGLALSLRVIFGVFAMCVSLHGALAETIVDEWASVKSPPPPALKPVTVDPKTTALLMLDFNQQTCNAQRRPRCVASIPKVKSLLAAARSAGLPVAFSLGGGGKPADLPDALAAAPGEPVVSSGVDKFRNTELEKMLKDKGVTTVIVVGTAAHGAVLYTASAAAMLGFKVVLPVDGISADLPYAEQYVAWQLANVPVLSPSMTLTSIDQLKFQ